MSKPQSLINLQANVFQYMPTWLKTLALRFKYYPAYNEWRNKSADGYAHTQQLLGPLQNKYAGYRCVVIANGPSLRQMDLSVLKDEYTFGLNRIYLMFEELGFETSFLVSVNRLVLQQSGVDIQKTDTLKFLNWHHKQYVGVDDKTAFICPRPGYGKLDGQVLDGYCADAGTVTIAAIELAYFMGFSQVILIGADHSFAEKGTPNKAITSTGADQNHFSPNYFGKGYVWQLPDLDAMDKGYYLSRKLFKENNRSIVDATLGGKLQVFEKGNFEEYLSNPQYKNLAWDKELT